MLQSQQLWEVIVFGINFYDEALESLERFKKISCRPKVAYAHYLIAIIYYEQIIDEKKDVAPLIKARDKIDFSRKISG